MFFQQTRLPLQYVCIICMIIFSGLAAFGQKTNTEKKVQRKPASTRPINPEIEERQIISNLTDTARCIIGKHQAILHIQHDTIQFRRGGYTFEQNYPYHKITFQDVLLNKYGVKSDLTGCMMDLKVDSCYNATMDSTIRSRFGDEVYTNAKKTADSLTKLEIYIQPIQSKNGSATLGKALIERLSLDWLKENAPQNKTFTLSFELDETGDLNIASKKECKEYNQSNSQPNDPFFNKKLYKNLKKVIRKDVQWLPALNGHKKPVKSMSSIYISNKPNGTYVVKSSPNHVVIPLEEVDLYYPE